MTAPRVERRVPALRFRFRLRTLLLLLTIACLVIGLVVHRAQRQKAGVTAVREAGGRVEYAHEQRTGTGYPPGPQWLRELIGDEFFFRPVRVSLRSTNATDEHAAALENLIYLTRLDLDYTQVSELGFLRGLRRLEWLDLESTRIDDDDLFNLRHLTNLKYLILDHTAITDEGLAHLAGMRSLTYLRLVNTNVTGAGVAYLKHVPLTEIDFTDSRLTDEGLAQTRDIPTLRSLNLSGTRVTDAGLMHLEALPGLQDVDLRGTAVTEGGASRLTGLRHVRRVEVDDD